MEKLGISDELQENDLHHSPTTRTGGALPMRVKLQRVICEDDGQEETVTDVVTLKKDHRRMEHLGLTLAEAKQLLNTIQHRVLQRQVDTFLDACSMCKDCGTPLKVKGFHTRAGSVPQLP